MTINEFSSMLNTLNRVAIYTVTYIICAKIVELILRSLNLRVLAFFPGISVEVVYCLIDVFLVPFVGVYALLVLGRLISRH